MSEQKFKVGEYYVVKCDWPYARSIWGRVVFCACDKDKLTIVGGDDVVYSKSSLFPLPEQGDKVEVSENGIDWYDNDCVYVANYKNEFIINEPIIQFASANYIRPIESKSELSPEVMEYVDRLKAVGGNHAMAQAPKPKPHINYDDIFNILEDQYVVWVKKHLKEMFGPNIKKKIKE